MALTRLGSRMAKLAWCPDFRSQHLIVAEIEAEQAVAAFNRELIRRMEAKV